MLLSDCLVVTEEDGAVTGLGDYFWFHSASRCSSSGACQTVVRDHRFTFSQRVCLD